MGTNTAQNGSGVGTRFTALKQAFECALGAAFTEVSPEEFVAYFPTLPDPQRAAAYDLYRQVMHLERANSEAVYQDIMEENQMWARLATLEQMCEEQGLDAHGGITRSTAEAPAAAAARSRVRAMTAECEVLTAQLAKLGQQRAEEAAAIEAKKRRIADAAASLKAVPQQLSSIESASRSWNAQPVDPAM